VAVTGVSLNKTATAILVGGTETLTAAITPSNATNQNITWSSDNESVATVNTAGLVTAVAEGTAIITVTTADGGFTEVCAVTVNSVAVTGVSLNKTATTLFVGGTETLIATIAPSNATNQNLTWTTSDDSVATVNSAGLVTAVAEGTATITVTTADGGFTAVCAVTVNPVVVTGVSLNKTALTLIVGGTETLTATVAPANATNQNVTWTSGDTNVATVNNAGLVTGVAVGMATITVTTEDGGKTADCTVTVTPPPPGTQMIRTLSSGVSVSFRYVPAGSFQRDTGPANISIITRGYWMGETEVTQELFEAVMETGVRPSNCTSNPEDSSNPNGWKKLPVESVSWYDAIAFCNKLSLADGKEPVYSVSGITDWATLAYIDIPTSTNGNWNAAIMDTTKNGYRLPTEMEWMWAAMGADTENPGQPNTTGYLKAFAGSNGSNSIDDYAWYNSIASSKTHEVSKKTANELGLKDMSGNVNEWCWDWYGSSYPTGSQPDYPGGTSGSYRVVRGGSWSNNATDCTVAFRDHGYLGYGSFTLGFRVVCP
jgi:uncharacterized protein YjdB